MKRHSFFSFRDGTIISLLSILYTFLVQAIVAVLRSTFGFPLPWRVNRRPQRTLSKANVVEFNFTPAPIDNFMEVGLWECSYCRKNV